MDRVNRILQNKDYKESIDKIKKCEKERIFCRHDMVHFLNVSRIAEIMWLENLLVKNESDTTFVSRPEYKELIYAAGLLHDMGRWQEYEEGICHEKASAVLAPDILRKSGFKEREIEEIVQAILNHRNAKIAEENNLSGYLYRADKKSRACFACEVREKCNWSDEKKNLKLE